jgi:hypothetical protein
MPKLRLSEVIAEKSIIIEDLSTDVQAAIARVSAQEETLDKLNAEVSKDLRAISASLNVSILNLFTQAEKFYRLKIFENLNEPEYSGSPKEKLEKLLAKLPSNSKISFPLLGIYATQTLPESLLKGKDLQQICKSLNTSLKDLKDNSSAPNQTISIDSILRNLDITLDELSILLEVPKNIIPWISSEIKNSTKANFGNIIKRSDLESINTEALNFTSNSASESFRLPNMCDLFPCPSILCTNCPR